MVSPEEKRAAVAHLRQTHGTSERRAWGLVGQPRSTYRYQRQAELDDGLRERIAKLAAERRRFTYRRLRALLRRQGVLVWHGRVHHITKELRLQVPRRKRKRIGRRAASSKTRGGITTAVQMIHIWLLPASCFFMAVFDRALS